MGEYGNSQVNSGLIAQKVMSLGVKFSSDPAVMQAIGVANYSAVNKEVTESMKQNTIALYEQECGSGSWNALSNDQKEQYIQAYSDGRLTKAITLGRQLEQFHNELPNIKNPAQASQKLVTLIASAIPGFDKAKTPEEQHKFCETAILKLIAQQTNRDINTLTPDAKEYLINRFGTLLQAAFFAEQNGKISSILDIQNLSKEEIASMEYEYATYMQHNHNNVYDRDITLKIAKEKGDLERAIVANFSEVKSIEELHNSNLRYQLEFKYLKSKPTEKLSDYELSELHALTEVAEAYNGDLTNIKIDSDHSACASNLKPIFDEDVINWNDPANLIILKNYITANLAICKTPEERANLLKAVLQTSGVEECLAVNRVLSMLEKEAIISTGEWKHTHEESGQSFHMAAMASPELSTQGQLVAAHMAVERATGEEPEFTGTQAAGVMENVFTEYAREVQSEAVNEMVDTGIPEVKEAVADTMEKMDTEAAKETYDHVMQSNVYTEEEKQEIARDSIDKLDTNKKLTDDQKAELKDYYIKTAEKHNIDYTQALPRAERPNYVNRKTTTENNSIADIKNQKIEGTNLTVGEFQAILEKAMDENPIETLIENPLEALQSAATGIKESLIIIGGNTLDIINRTGIRQISSVTTAMRAIGKGVKLDVVFKNCSENVQRTLVQNICLYYPQALAPLIDKFNGKMILDLAQTPQAKQRVLDEWANVALNDASERNNLATTITKDANIARDFLRDNRFESLG